MKYFITLLSLILLIGNGCSDNPEKKETEVNPNQADQASENKVEQKTKILDENDFLDEALEDLDLIE